jgi:hypothetical protein
MFQVKYQAWLKYLSSLNVEQLTICVKLSQYDKVIITSFTRYVVQVYNVYAKIVSKWLHVYDILRMMCILWNNFS